MNLVACQLEEVFWVEGLGPVKELWLPADEDAAAAAGGGGCGGGHIDAAAAGAPPVQGQARIHSFAEQVSGELVGCARVATGACWRVGGLRGSGTRADEASLCALLLFAGAHRAPE